MKTETIKTEFICPRCGAHLRTFRERQHYKLRLVDRDPMYFCAKCDWYSYESRMDLDKFTKEVQHGLRTQR